jgi:isoaspartyl peptidase/L-asparaginase-like protein (Ntn-hydrolase superfamily)
MSEPVWSLLLHGGASACDPGAEEGVREALLEAAAVGCRILAAGGSAVEAVEQVVRVLEDQPLFNAGYGSVLNADGEVEMDAALMDGETLDIGGVAAIQAVRHPISVARLMLREKPTLLAAEGARRFAVAMGAELCPREALIAPHRRIPEPTAVDTVGCIALDTSGRTAAASSTGGLTDKHPGRVGDSPLPGCGLYADDRIGAVTLSGEGEAIARTALAGHAMHDMERADPQAAADGAVARMGRVGGDVGAIVLDVQGRIGWAHNSEDFPVAVATAAMSGPQAFLKRTEAKEGFERG